MLDCQAARMRAVWMPIGRPERGPNLTGERAFGRKVGIYC